ncbi:MAG: tRNA glutamyl-Q(34) synthetase GluQRS [Rheinheimera sp.]|nr:tRNA glutamyl-Q(34) synthetase GluQRS [Rheinheimera sp.]
MMTAEFSCIRGRFAPSPSGPLHFGSLVAAVGSYLHAKSQAGQWLVRIEDIDAPRTVPGADSEILRTLEQFGLHWDDSVVWQSQRLDLYQHYFEKFQQQLYGCQCNRARIAALGGIYDGHCQTLQLSSGQDGPLAWRLHAVDVANEFTDIFAGNQRIPTTLAAEDYIIKRRDGLFAYQWVVVIDDIEQQISEVIRGADLLQMTPRQQALCRAFGAAMPVYGHLPLAVKAPGHKLSKQNHATDIRRFAPAQSLTAALQFLGQPVPADATRLPVAELLQFALTHWQNALVPRQGEIQIDSFN